MSDETETEREEMKEDRAPRRGRPSKRVSTGRRRRVPLGTPEQKLFVPQAQDDPDSVYRWVNDSPGRLQKALNGGYVFVEDPTLQVGTSSENGNSENDSRVSRLVGKDAKGFPMLAYLMKIDRTMYDEDQAVKQASIDEVDNTIRHGRHNEKAGDGRYIPQEGINIK